MSFVPSTCQQLPIMNKIALRVRYPPDYHPQEEPVRLPLGLFNDLLLELQNLSARYLSLNQEFDPTSIALELKVRDKASRSGPKEAAGKQKVESRIQDDEDRNARSDENKMEAKPAGGNDPLDYAHAEVLAHTQPSETLNPNQEAKHDQWNENVPFTLVKKEEVANDANAEKKAEFHSRPASKQPIETESAPSIPSIPSVPKEPTFPKLPKILAGIGMSESRWASPNSGKSRRGGGNSRYGRGGSLSGGHSPTSSQQGSIVSLPQSQEEKWNRNHGRAQESSNWGDNSAGAGGTNGDGWGSDLIPTLPPRDEPYTWVSDSITEKTKQLDSVPTGKTQPQVDGNDWGADTVPAEVKRGHGAKKRSHDWGAKTGNDDYSHSRPVRDSWGGRGAQGGNLGYGRLNTEFNESSSGWNSPSVHKHSDENNGWDTGTSPKTKHSNSVASGDWVTTGLADVSPRSPRSARGGRGGDHGDYSRGEGGGPRGRGSWNGVAQSAYNRSTDIKAGIEPAGSGQGNTAPSWGDDSNFAASKESQDLNDSDAGHPDVSKKSQDAESPSGSAEDPASAWDDKPGWRPSRFKKHEPKW